MVRVECSNLWLARNEGMDPCSSLYLTHYSGFHVLFHSLIVGQGPRLQA